MASIRKRTWTTPSGETKTAWAVDFSDAAGKRQRRQFNTKREADAFRIESEGAIKKGTYRADADKVTLTKAATTYLEYLEGRRDRGERMSTKFHAVVRGHVFNYIDPQPDRDTKRGRTRTHVGFSEGLGAVKIGQLSASAVADFRDRLRSHGVSVPTTRKILATLSRILDHAISRDLLAVNVARSVEVIGRREEGSQKIVPPTKVEMKALLDGAPEDFRLALAFAAATGLRAGEQWGLKWKCVDLKKGEVRVTCRVDQYGAEDLPKTDAGLRTVPIGDSIVAQLKAWKLQSKHSGPEDHVFANSRGGHRHHSNVLQDRFYPLRTKTGVEHLNWHALRHFAVSLWIEAGLPPKAIQTYAGHSTLTVTMDRYGHLFPAEDHRTTMSAIAKDLF
jgi:integrase